MISPPVRTSPGPWEQTDLERMTQRGFQSHLGITLESASSAQVRLSLKIEPHHANSVGGVHGGVLMALADSAGAMGALLNLPQGCTTATVESHVHFLRPVTGSVLFACAEPVHRGGRISIWRTSITSSDEALIAQITQTQIILRKGRQDDAG